jgi:competence protein ComEC
MLTLRISYKYRITSSRIITYDCIMNEMFENHTLTTRTVTLSGLLLFAFVVWVTPYIQSQAGQSASLLQTSRFYLTVTFLDVGQGDAILIETPDGVQVLIDGGPDAGVVRELNAVLPWFDRSLDMVVGTHPDKDHIGGLVDVLKKFTVHEIITTENTGETTTAEAYYDALTQEGATISMARSGSVYALGASTTLTIFSPAADPSMLESNTASIVAQVRYGEIEIMLTGDAPSSIENYLVETYGAQLQSEVLKLGHHGSKTSSSEEFLRTVSPQFAVVSSGLDNSYGHPAKEVVERVSELGVPLVNTAEEGRVTFQTDGKTVWKLP